MTDTPAPLSAGSLRDDRIAKPSWIAIVAKIGLAYTGEVRVKANNELIEDAKEDFESLIATALQSERQRIADSLPEKAHPNDHGIRYAEGFNDCLEAVRAVLIPPTSLDGKEQP